MAEQNCLFCAIAHKQIPASIVYEDEDVIAFLDINPLVNGHVILTTKEHYMFFQMIPGDKLLKITAAIKKISQSMISKLRCPGTTIFNANGGIAGQNAPHTIIHIIPRFKDDGILSFFIPEIASDESKIKKAKQNFVELINQAQKQQQKANLEQELTRKFN